MKIEASIVIATRDKAPSLKNTLESIFAQDPGIAFEVIVIDDGSTDWHDTLRTLTRRRSVDQIEEMFERRLGFGPRSYIASIQDEDQE